jgi:5-methylcytosine-specific restriction protein A
MPLKAARPCTTPGCRQPAATGGKCTACRSKQRQLTDMQRGNPRARGYRGDHESRFRRGVLSRDAWVCVDCGGYGDVADHAPLERAELVAMGEDPNDPAHGVTRCQSCHNKKTARTRGTTPRRATER